MNNARVHYPNICLDCGKGIQAANKRCRECFKESIKGKKNINWKGSNVSYISLHQWVRTNKPIPLCCEKCGKKKSLDAANISGEYKRDLRDWCYLCRSCHMKDDGRINNLKQFRGKDGRS